MQKPSPLIRPGSRSNLYLIHVNEHDVPYIELGEQPPSPMSTYLTAPGTTNWPSIGQMNPAPSSITVTITHPEPEAEHITQARARGERIFTLMLDDRFGITAPESEVERWASFLADAMAISAGYTSHGKNSRRLNRHGVSR
jgi:hypothetical protein